MAVTLVALVGGGYVVPIVLLAAVVLPSAAAARVFGSVIRLSLIVTLPITVSVVLVSVLTRAGTTVLFEIGPIDATLEGVDFAARIVLRLVAMATALVLFGLTTEPRALVAELERRGVSPRLTFVAVSALDAVPALVERGRAVVAAQRARALDTEGSLGARLRGVLPVVGPVVLSTLHQVEARSLALDARGFGRPGRRHLLWTPPDSSTQRLVRWLLVLGVVAIVIARATGALLWLP